MDIRNKIKSYIVREGMTMTELVEKLAGQFSWSASVPKLPSKLRRGSLHYYETVGLADALGYEINRMAEVDGRAVTSMHTAISG